MPLVASRQTCNRRGTGARDNDDDWVAMRSTPHALRRSAPIEVALQQGTRCQGHACISRAQAILLKCPRSHGGFTDTADLRTESETCAGHLPGKKPGDILRCLDLLKSQGFWGRRFSGSDRVLRLKRSSALIGHQAPHQTERIIGEIFPLLGCSNRAQHWQPQGTRASTD